MKIWIGTIISVFCVLMVSIGIMFALLQGTKERIDRLDNEIKGLRSQSFHLEEELHERASRAP